MGAGTAMTGGVVSTEVAVSDAVAVSPSSAAETVCAPGAAGVQVAPAQAPSGVMEKVVDEVKSPRPFPAASRPRTV
jgi:hypothetical protein